MTQDDARLGAAHASIRDRGSLLSHRGLNVPNNLYTRRGVFRLPFEGAAGEVVLVAISRHGRRVAEVELDDPINAREVNTVLHRLLDILDPQPPLRPL